MKFSLSCLKEFLETSLSVDEICKTLTRIGLEVESLEDKSEIYKTFSVGKIVEAKNHENSSKLKICLVEVDAGKILQIICGANNARSGIKVVYAAIGSVIPANKMVIKKAKIAGIESNGMLCSASELGLCGSDDGIIEIDEKWPVGTKISEVFALNDAVIEINVTPNRGDCLGVLGVARDLAAAGAGTLKNFSAQKIPAKFSSPITVKNEASDVCSYAVFRHLKNLKNCQSPQWMREKLQSAGMNSISAIVDVTNYVMLMLNRPMHAYDATKISSPISIRFAKNSEKFTSLKNEELILDAETLVIADAEKVIGMAGIIGGINSSCDLNTSEIFLEAAHFSPSAIARTGRKFNILSDARHRFERNVDDKSCDDGIEFATALILEICGGEASDIETVGTKSATKTVEFDADKIKKLTNVEVSNDKVYEILTALGFVIKNSSGQKFIVEIPTYRIDVATNEDLVEEVIRIFGYDKIVKEKLETFSSINSNNRLSKVRNLLAINGLIETINWSFCDEKLVEFFAVRDENLMLANPISSELNHMRPNLLIGLLQSYKKNALRGFSDLSLFEIGNVFLPQQNMIVATLRAGKNKEQNHYHDERDFDVFDVKKDAFEIVKSLGLNPENLQTSEENLPKFFHPHRAAALKLGKNTVGHFGEIHPQILKHFDLKTRVNYCEIFVDNIPVAKVKSALRKAFIANDLQIVERDFAFLVNTSQSIGNITRTVAGCDSSLISGVEIFDIFSGKNVPDGKKSVALRVKIQPIEKTLTSEEIDVISEKIIDAVRKNHDATLREMSA